MRREVIDFPELFHLPHARWRSRFADALPGDDDVRNVPRPAPGACYSLVAPTPVAAPRLLMWSEALGRTLGLQRPREPTGATARLLAGNTLLPWLRPYAARYGGHQFGHWAGQLGDGRAISLGEVAAADGGIVELQLKGAGPTPYARHADGRAVLRSSLREFLCSEAMFHLGIPTTRALSLVATGETVRRDMFYDGHPEDEPGAIVCRVAPSFIRFGNFQIHAAEGETAALRALASFTVATYFPDLAALPEPARWAAFLAEVGRRTGELVAHWMRVGFVHGVMNTDNLSILGLTIDYGPYGWLDHYDPEWTPNTTDAAGRRYCYGRQPVIAAWNLARLGEALLPLGVDEPAIQDGVDGYWASYETHWRAMLAAKLGWPAIDDAGDGPLLDRLFRLLAQHETDWTIFFRRLGALPLAENSSAGAALPAIEPAFYGPPNASLAAAWAAWLSEYAARSRQVARGDRARVMARANPRLLPRNYLAQRAIDALAAGDAGPAERLLDALRRPYDNDPAADEFDAKRPEWARRRAGCSMLSCSS